MPQPDKRSVLQVLTRARLRELVEAFELKLAAAESKDAHVELRARSKKATLPRLLDHILRDERKDICSATARRPADRPVAEHRPAPRPRALPAIKGHRA